MGTLSWSQDWANPLVEVGGERDTEVPWAVGGAQSISRECWYHLFGALWLVTLFSACFPALRMDQWGNVPVAFGIHLEVTSKYRRTKGKGCSTSPPLPSQARAEYLLYGFHTMILGFAEEEGIKWSTLNAGLKENISSGSVTSSKSRE